MAWPTFGEGCLTSLPEDKIPPTKCGSSSSTESAAGESGMIAAFLGFRPLGRKSDCGAVQIHLTPGEPEDLLPSCGGQNQQLHGRAEREAYGANRAPYDR